MNRFCGTEMCLAKRRTFCVKIITLLVVISIIFLYYAVNKIELSHRFRLKYFSKLSAKVFVRSTSSIVEKESVPLVKKKLTYDGKVFRFGNGTEEIKLALVICGNHLNHTIVSLKSVLIFSLKRIHFIFVADDNNRQNIAKRMLEWPEKVLQKLSFEIHPIAFPKDEGEEWKKLFKLCACQRLFLPSLLHHIDSVVYMDTDVLFIKPVENIWKYFHKMNSSQIAALCPEHEDFATGWYNRFARHPYYEPLGVNSGIMLMNLTRMRKFQWETYLSPIMKEYKLNIVWGDQDIINIIFHFHSDKLLIIPCEWNYRPDHCMYSSVCKSAENYGISVLHGNRGVFYNDKQPAFKAIFGALYEHNIEDNGLNIFDSIKKSLEKDVNTRCGKSLNSIFNSMTYTK